MKKIKEQWQDMKAKEITLLARLFIVSTALIVTIMLFLLIPATAALPALLVFLKHSYWWLLLYIPIIPVVFGILAILEALMK